jgi:hypothetical protein
MLRKPINLTVHARLARALNLQRVVSEALSISHPSFRPISATLTSECLHDTPNASFLILELTLETTCSTEKYSQIIGPKVDL